MSRLTRVIELFDKAVDFTDYNSIGAGEYVYNFYVDKNHYKAGIAMTSANAGKYDLTFALVGHEGEHNYGIERVGTTTAIAVFSTVMEIVKSFISKVNPNQITFTADKSAGSSRSDLYASMVRKYTPSGWSFKVSPSSRSDSDRFTLTKD